MHSTYESATRHYAEIVEQTRGRILQEKPFSYWLEEMKRSGMFWGA